jgi:hypothetical protein
LTAEPSLSEILERSDSEAVQAYQMLQAMVKLARNQIVLEARLEEQDVRLEDHGSQLEDHARRLEQLEDGMGPRDAISDSQASQISQAVKAIAMELSKRSGRNEYGGVYGELYRRFEITSYKLLPANRFEEAMKFLTDWHQSLTGDLPF